ncbi:hypothetical protein JCM8097_001277 [Rhodosporidiobolus ruineniae]
MPHATSDSAPATPVDGHSSSDTSRPPPTSTQTAELVRQLHGLGIGEAGPSTAFAAAQTGASAPNNSPELAYHASPNGISNEDNQLLDALVARYGHEALQEALTRRERARATQEGFREGMRLAEERMAGRLAEERREEQGKGGRSEQEEGPVDEGV